MFPGSKDAPSTVTDASTLSGGGAKSALHYLVYTGCHTVASQDGAPRQRCVAGQPGSLINTDQCRLANPDTQTQDIFASPTGAPGSFTEVAHTCVDKNAGDPVPLAEVTAAAQRLIDQLRPPDPHFTVAPPNGQTLVNFRTLLSADANQTVTKNVLAAGVPITITAEPVAWNWIADDQIVTTTDWPGRAYDGTDPKTAPPDYYIWHSFDHHGAHTLAVHVTWNATATLPGGTPLPVNGQVTAESPVRPITALEARSQLTSGFNATLPQ